MNGKKQHACLYDRGRLAASTVYVHGRGRSGTSCDIVRCRKVNCEPSPRRCILWLLYSVRQHIYPGICSWAVR